MLLDTPTTLNVLAPAPLYHTDIGALVERPTFMTTQQLLCDKGDFYGDADTSLRVENCSG